MRHAGGMTDARTWRQCHADALPLLLGLSGLGFAALQLALPAFIVPAALCAFLLGIPHGAVERDGHGRRTRPPGLAYSTAYIVCGGAVLVLWVVAPWPVLVVSLALSAWHFAQSEWEPRGVGVFAVLACFAVFPELTLAQFSALTGHAPIVETAWLRLLGLCGVAALWLSPGWRANWASRLVLTGLFLVLHPVAAVATYFLAWHSLGETAALLDADSERARPWRTLMHTYGRTALPALLGAAALLGGVYAGAVPVTLAAGLGVAFVVPHMLPLERWLQRAHLKAALR